MFQSSKNIILISFEQATLTNVLKCISDYMYSTTSKDVLVDFYLYGDVEKAKSLNDITTEGLKMTLKCRETNRAKSLYYYSITHNEINKLQSYINKFKNQNKANGNTCIIYCFNFNNLLQGYGFFESVEEDDSIFLKCQLTDFMFKNLQICSYNLVYFPQDYKNEKTKWLSKQINQSNTYLNGKNLSTFFSEHNKNLEQFHYFLRLPTYLVVNNNFIPKIPF